MAARLQDPENPEARDESEWGLPLPLVTLPKDIATCSSWELGSGIRGGEPGPEATGPLMRPLGLCLLLSEMERQGDPPAC